MNLRIGYGFDVHRLKEGNGIILGGVKIPHTKSLVAHSDGDVLIHAICDALLGAANMRDIGYHFPDTSADFKDIDSKILLEKTVNLIADKGYKIVNLDTTICLQQPKIKDFIPEMQDVLSSTMNISKDNINIKATTTERLGFEGREEGISAHCACLISS